MPDLPIAAITSFMRLPSYFLYSGFDLLAARAGGGDACGQLGHLTPHLVLGDLQVDDVDRHVRAPADLDGLGDGLEDTATLGAHVGRVDAAVAGGDLAHGDERVGVDPRSGRSAERAGDAERALLHRLLHQRAHAVELGGRGRAGFLAVDGRPDLARSDVGADVGRDAALE